MRANHSNRSELCNLLYELPEAGPIRPIRDRYERFHAGGTLDSADANCAPIPEGPGPRDRSHGCRLCLNGADGGGSVDCVGGI